MTWEIKHFKALTTTELYECIKLRLEIFVEEQACIYVDLDDKDKSCYHLLGYEDGMLVAYLRILPKGISYEQASLGRIAVCSQYRKKHLGHKLVQRGIDYIIEELGECEIKISAQSYAIPFYEKLGFQVVSEEYLEDGIPHKKMLYTYRK